MVRAEAAMTDPVLHLKLTDPVLHLQLRASRLMTRRPTWYLHLRLCYLLFRLVLAEGYLLFRLVLAEGRRVDPPPLRDPDGGSLLWVDCVARACWQAALAARWVLGRPT
jgi:hypothetical protein